MPKVRITSLPKFQFGPPNDCPTGMVYDASMGQCVYDTGYDPSQEANKGTPIVGTTNAAGEKVGGTGAIEQPFHNSQAFTIPCPPGFKKNNQGQCVPKGGTLNNINYATQTLLNVGSAAATIKDNQEQQKAFKEMMRRKSLGNVVNPGGRLAFGHTEINSGIEFPNLLTPPNEGMFSNYTGRTIAQNGGQFGGMYGLIDTPEKIRIKITGTPDEKPQDDMQPLQMKYGGQQSGGYGFDSGWKKSYTKMNEMSSDHYTNTMSEQEDGSPKVIEAEGGETLYKPGDESLHFFEGNRHVNGGMDISEQQLATENKKSPAFIFSDTAKLRIKDPKILAHFGITSFSKGGVTPAQISKRFDLNKYKAIIEDKDKDNLSKSTAKLMLDKNQKMLDELAVIQEGMKNQKAPKYIEQRLEKGYKAEYGGYYGDGGETNPFIPKYAPGGATVLTTTAPPPAGFGDWSDDYSELEQRLTSAENEPLRKALYNRYKAQFPRDRISQEDYIKNFLTAQKHIFALQNRYKATPNVLKERSWDTGGVNTRYNKEISALGYTPLSVQNVKRFQAGFKGLADLMADPAFNTSFGQYFKINPTGRPDQKYRGMPISGTYQGWFGNTTNAEMVALRDRVTTTTTMPPEVTTTTTLPVPEVTTTTTLPAEVTTTTTLPVGITTTTTLPVAVSTTTLPPFIPPRRRDFLFPDKVNMLAKAAVFPRKIFPYYADMAYNPRQLYLEDWRAKAAARQSLYNTQANVLGTYGPTQGMGANLSSMAGQTAEGVAQDISNVASRNIDRANQFTKEEAARQDEVQQYNLANKDKRYKGYATTLQNFDNALRGYLKENTDALTRAWKNRMHMGMIGDTSKYFDINHWTGEPVFKGGQGTFASLPSTYGGNDDYTGTGTAYGTYYKKYKDDNIAAGMSADKAEQRAHELAMMQIRADRYRVSEDPYRGRYNRTSYGFDFGDNGGYDYASSAYPGGY